MLSEAQMRRLQPFFPVLRGLRRVDDRRVISSIGYVIRHGLQWKDARPATARPRPSMPAHAMEPVGVFARIFKLHAACYGQGRPVALLLTKGQRSDHHGAALLRPILPRARELQGDRGYDSAWFRTALIKRSIAPCIPSTRVRKVPLPYDRTLYRQRHRIENVFRLKDWRRVATRYDRCAHTFFSAICIAATVIFWL